MVVVPEADAVLTLAPLENVIESADPANPVPLGWGFARRIAEGKKESSVRRVHPSVAIPGEGPGSLLGFTPGFAFVLAGHEKRIELAAILPQQHQQSLAVR